MHNGRAHSRRDLSRYRWFNGQLTKTEAKGITKTSRVACSRHTALVPLNLRGDRRWRIISLWPIEVGVRLWIIYLREFYSWIRFHVRLYRFRSLAWCGHCVWNFVWNVSRPHWYRSLQITFQVQVRMILFYRYSIVFRVPCKSVFQLCVPVCALWGCFNSFFRCI